LLTDGGADVETADDGAEASRGGDGLQSGDAPAMTRTRAVEESFSAAVVIIGKRRRQGAGGEDTALYPAMDAMEESASMLWAREMRGIISMRRDGAAAKANFAARSGLERGSQKPIDVFPFQPSGRGTRTWTKTAAFLRTSSAVARCAPFAA